MSRATNKEHVDEFTINEGDTRIDESAVETALNETGFGKFSFKISIICYLIYMNLSMSIIVTGFILPAAGCDLKMNMLDKSLFSTAFLVGTFFSTIISGFVTNLKGRRWTLLFGLFLQGNADFLQSIVSNYWVMIGLKILSGFGSAAQNFVFTYFSECIPEKNRSFILSFMEIFWIIGHALAAGIGWGIIPLKFEIHKQYFLFRSWNLFILICSLPSILLGIWLIFFPETPKFLAETGSREKLLQVLVEMYEQNFKKPGKFYIEKLLTSGNSSLVKLANQNSQFNQSHQKPIVIEKICHELKQITYVLRPPILKNTIFASMTAFSVTSSFYSLFLWLPEIFQRFANLEAGNTNQKINFCEISRDDPFPVQSMNNLTSSFGCDRPVDNKVYINNLILCAACIPAIIIISFFVKRCGLKITLAACCILCLIDIIGIYFVNSSLQNLILLCIYLALASTSMTLQFAYCVTIFPTNFRSSGTIITGIFCRFGSLFGNFIFSNLKNHCVYFILLVSLLLLVSAVATILVRERKNE